MYITYVHNLHNISVIHMRVYAFDTNATVPALDILEHHRYGCQRDSQVDSKTNRKTYRLMLIQTNK